jgi:hypothetical protein
VEKTARRGALLSVIVTKYYSGDQIKNNEMGAACSSDGEERGAYMVLVGKTERNGRLGMRRIDEGIILKWISKKWDWEHGSNRYGS